MERSVKFIQRIASVSGGKSASVLLENAMFRSIGPSELDRLIGALAKRKREKEKEYFDVLLWVYIFSFIFFLQKQT